MCVAGLLVLDSALLATDEETKRESAQAQVLSSEEVAALKAQLAAQQSQIDQLRKALEKQQKLLEQSVSGSTGEPAPSVAEPVTPKPFNRLGEVASRIPVLPSKAGGGSVPTALNDLVKTGGQKTATATNPCEAVPEGPAPAFIRLGSTCIVPVGFLDLTAVWRDKNPGSSIGSNFGSVPFNNVAAGKNSEFHFSPQNSRLGVRIDGDWKGAHFIGYNEFDFLGTSASTALSVTNGAFVPRLRLFWVDVRKGPLEFLAGQSWSMLTPNRKGISPLPGDLFYTQVVDVNYVIGLTWTRQPGMRVLFHPNDKVTVGFSAENPDQYIGGSAGGSGITLPAALGALASTQLDNAPNISTGSNPVQVTPTIHPDFIVKLALDPSSRFHFEVAGIERTFRVWNPNTAPALGAGTRSTVAGGGIQAGFNAEIFKNFRVISTNYWSDGGGRYLFGQAPDAIVRSDGSLSLIHSGGTVDGFEATVKNFLIYAYYGGVYVGRNTALDANGTTKIGYGYAGAPNSQNRAINEITFGFNQTFWRSPRYGAINLMTQYEWLQRDPWAIATGAPKAAHDSTIYVNVRYTLPGGIPNF